MSVHGVNGAASAIWIRKHYTISWFIAVLWVYGGASGDYLEGKFNSQVQRILKDEMLTSDQIANLSTVFPDLQQTLQTKWPGSKVYALGSFVTGLASKTSDADCMVTVPRHYTSSETSESQLVIEAAQLLAKHPQLYDKVRPKVHPNRRIALLKFIYIPTQRNCDVNFISNLGFHNTQMMAYYFSLNDKFLTLAAILKFWSKVQGLRSSRALASNTLNLLTIFYLQQEKLAPPFYLLQKKLLRCPVHDWETNFERKKFNNFRKLSLYQLLGGFFKYYSEFDFDKYVVSPLLGSPIRKKQFENIDSLPEEFSLYKSYMTKSNSKPLTLDTKMCVQDVIEQRRNTADVPQEAANKFISRVKLAARMFNIVPKDHYLRSILSDIKEMCRLTSFISIKDCFNATDYYNNKL